MEELFAVNNVWMMLAAALVFVMHLGFAALESGMTQSKNTVNILFKNVFIICAGILTYAACGFSLMYPGDFNGFMGFAGFGLNPGPNGSEISYADGAYTYWTDFLFQAMFAATCLTIVSGAVAERIKLKSFVIFCVPFVALAYPIAGSWKWGGGFLDGLGFYDFAGSTIVHAFGGMAALVGAYLLGSRIGKEKGIFASNLPMATVGTFLLWLGWFGFNGGSVLSADPALTSYVLVTTCLAAAAGGLASIVTSLFITNKADLSMALNGILAGLVSITAGADVVGVLDSMIIGMLGGSLVVVSIMLLDQVLKIDDPVGAVSVHLTCGVWGTLAVGLFSAEHSFFIQLLGTSLYLVFSGLISYGLFYILKSTIGIRVEEADEEIGLDLVEHGCSAYSGSSGTATAFNI